MQARESTLPLKSRADVTRSPEYEYQWPHKMDGCSQKSFKKSLVAQDMRLFYKTHHQLCKELLKVKRGNSLKKSL